VRASGFAPATAVAEVAEGAHVGALVRLLLLSEPISFDAGANSVVRQSNVHVIIPAGSLLNAKGEPVAGMAEATVALLDPTTDSIQGVPGPLVGVSGGGGDTVELESISMVEISLWQGGEPLQLAPTATSMIEIPVPEFLASKYPAGTQIPSWSYNLDQGVWEEGEMGAVEVSERDPNRLIWVVPVHHFTWWNSDHPFTEKHCYDVLVVDSQGKPVPNQPVTGVGVSYVGISWTKYTSASGLTTGHACVDVQRGSTARIYLGSTDNPNKPPNSPFMPVNAGSVISSCDGHGAACEMIKIPLTSLDVCPAAGASRPCPGGPPNVGECKTGTQTCGPDLKWQPCVGQVSPTNEICDGKDNDCNKIADDHVSCGCAVPQDCPGQDSECRQRTCSNGKCGIKNAPSGTPTASDTRGDCKLDVCDGNGNKTRVNDPTDVPTDKVKGPCQTAVCIGNGQNIPAVQNVPDNTACQSVKVCVSGSCVLPRCDDGFKNGLETDIDCGGQNCKKCPNNKKCNIPFDCDSNVCNESTKSCDKSNCNDKIKNGDETDVDCGGTVCLKCPPGKACNVGMTDCMSGNCANGTCL